MIPNPVFLQTRHGTDIGIEDMETNISDRFPVLEELIVWWESFLIPLFPYIPHLNHEQVWSALLSKHILNSVISHFLPLLSSSFQPPPSLPWITAVASQLASLLLLFSLYMLFSTQQPKRSLQNIKQSKLFIC